MFFNAIKNKGRTGRKRLIYRRKNGIELDWKPTLEPLKDRRVNHQRSGESRSVNVREFFRLKLESRKPIALLWLPWVNIKHHLIDVQSFQTIIK